MIKLSDGDIFEDGRALNQELTFDAAKGAFESKSIPLEKSKYAALGVCRIDDRLFTNLGLILSDQCEHTIKVAVFSDEANTIFKAHKEFGGSVFNQLEETFDYLMLCNQNKSEIKGLERIDKWDYPQEAIREALLNSIIHRDYGFSGSIIVNVNDTKMEFISIGGLLPGLTTEDIKSGISQPRNRKLADIFHRLRYIEPYGTGIRRIYTMYKNCPQQPTIIVTPNTFKIILPNQNNPSATSDICLGSEETDGSIRSMKIKDIHERKKIIDESKPDITVSIHLNSFKQDSSVRGAQSFYPGKKGEAPDFAAGKTGEKDNIMPVGSPSEESHQVAKKIQEFLKKNIDYGKDRVPMEKNDIYIFQNIYTPIVLIECGFLSNYDDVSIAKNPIFQQKIAESIMLALSEYYNLKPAKKLTVIDSRT